MAVKMKKLAKKEDIHSTLVPPAKGKGETIGLLLVFAVIFALMSLRFWAVSSEQQNLYLRPYQRLDKILTKTQPLIYQSLISSVEEIVYLRDEEGQWPEAELLEMENIPPFDEKFLPKNARGALWEGFDGGTWIDYIGQNQSSGEKITFLLRLIDLHTDYHPNPHPGTDYDPNRRVAAQVWIYPEAGRYYPGERLAEGGWFWVVRENDPSLQKPADQRSDKSLVKQKSATTKDTRSVK